MSGQTYQGAPTAAWQLTPSMEGRTIVRPDTVPLGVVHVVRRAFNGGPDNCPARPANGVSLSDVGDHLQWRAGQLSGQTGGRRKRCPTPPAPFNGGPDNCPARREGPTLVRRAGITPSMEGRTIVRPDRGGRTGSAAVDQPSMEGRTIVRPDLEPRGCPPEVRFPFNGGPDNCPARRRVPSPQS